MSDAAKNVEIEDVLASIRRLVSDEVANELAKSDQQDEVPAEATDDAEEQPADALVLTPSLRVTSAATPEKPADQPVDDETVSSVAENVALAMDAVEAEVLEDAEFELDVEDEAQAMAADVNDHAEESVSEGLQTPPLFLSTRDEGAEELESAAAPEMPEQLEPANDVEVMDDDITHEELDLSDEAATLDEAETIPEPTVEPEGALEAKIARLESMIGEQDEAWEGEGADAPKPMEWEDVDTTPVDEVIAEPTPEIPEDFDDLELDPTLDVAEEQVAEDAADLEILADTSEDVIDEDMLRDMVAAIVREELQGALGERITRNVRKLVRREIHRALASHELD